MALSRKTVGIPFFLLLIFSSCANHLHPEGKNVVFLTLDGVRWQEVFNGVDARLTRAKSDSRIFKNLFETLPEQAVIFGDRNSGKEMTVANPVNISLPAYQNMMAGFVQNCLSNNCDRIPVETLQERLIRELDLAVDQVASFASWNAIALAVENKLGNTVVNAGNFPFIEPFDREIQNLNQQQTSDHPPWGNARWDKYTFAQAHHYLKKYKPRFLYISLNDSDEWGHMNKYDEYVKTLQQYDEWIKGLQDTLRDMGEYGTNTTLIVSTDHGRGDGGNWIEHGKSFPESKFIWLYSTYAGMKPSTDPPKATYTHSDIRPTIETIMGLKPIQCEKCGQVISELLRE